MVYRVRAESPRFTYETESIQPEKNEPSTARFLRPTHIIKNSHLFSIWRVHRLFRGFHSAGACNLFSALACQPSGPSPSTAEEYLKDILGIWTNDEPLSWAYRHLTFEREQHSFNPGRAG